MFRFGTMIGGIANRRVVGLSSVPRDSDQAVGEPFELVGVPDVNRRRSFGIATHAFNSLDRPYAPRTIYPGKGSYVHHRQISPSEIEAPGPVHGSIGEREIAG